MCREGRVHRTSSLGNGPSSVCGMRMYRGPCANLVRLSGVSGSLKTGFVTERFMMHVPFLQRKGCGNDNVFFMSVSTKGHSGRPPCVNHFCCSHGRFKNRTRVWSYTHLKGRYGPMKTNTRTEHYLEKGIIKSKRTIHETRGNNIIEKARIAF